MRLAERRAYTDTTCSLPKPAGGLRQHCCTLDARSEVVTRMPSVPPTAVTADALSSAARRRSANQLILHALVRIASAAVLVRVMGLVSQIAITARFGAGAVMDAYFVASTLPILVAVLLTGAIEASVIPVYVRLRNQRSPEHATAVFSTVVNLFLLGGAVLTLVMLLLRRQLLFLTAPALDPSRMELATQLALVVFPVLLLMVMTGLLECVLNTEGQFGWPAYAAVLVPLATALLVLVAGARVGIAAIAGGMLAGVGLQLGVLVYRLRLARISYRPVLDWRLPEVALVFTAASPALLGAMVNQASPLVDQIFASFLSAGSISALSYATKIAGLPVSIMFVTVGRAALPYLAGQAATQDISGFKATLRLYMWAVGLGTAVISAFMLVLAHPLVGLLFQRGAFSPEDTSHTVVTLMGLAVGLVPMGLGFLLARAFSALGKNHVLMFVTIFSVIANAAFDYILARYWQSVGIALATSAVYCCTLVILLVMLHRNIGSLDLLTPPPELIQVIRGLATGEYYQTLLAWKDERLPMLQLPSQLRVALVCLGAAAVALAIGAAMPFLDPQLELRIAVGLPLILLLLRFRYALLLAWILVGTLVGSTLPIFSGNSINTGLTIPTLLLLATVPVFPTLRRVPTLAILLLYVLWLLVGIRGSPLDTATFLKDWLLYLDYATIAVLVVSAGSTRRRLLLLVDAMLAVGAFVALFGIAGYLTHKNGEFDPGTGTFRILSVFTAAPPLALFLSLVIPLAIYRAFVSRGLVRVGALGVLVVLIVALGLTFSRGALLSLPLSLVILALFAPSRRMRVSMLWSTMGLIGLAIIMATVGNISIFARFSGQDIVSLNGRTYLWQALLTHFDPWQLQGNGLGASVAILTRLSIGNGGIVGNGLIATAPSNLYIGTLYDTGAIGLGLLLAALTVLGGALVAGLRRTTGEHRLLFAMALLALINMLIQSVEEDDLWTQGIAVYFWITMALPFAVCWFKARPATDAADDGSPIQTPEPEGLRTGSEQPVGYVAEEHPGTERTPENGSMHEPK
jgi:murein biosynthesis integral membrane protein MurJ